MAAQATCAPPREASAHIVTAGGVRRRLERLTRTQALALVVGLLLALAWAGPSVGASVGKVARLALGRANEAFHNADLAINTSDAAKSTANSANTTADAASSTANAARSAAASAQSAANDAQSTANTAQVTANQALAQANSIVTPSYARMNQPCTVSQSCGIDHAKGVTAIRQTSTAGTYCIAVSGRSPSTSAWMASVDAGDTSTVTDAQALPVSGSPDCNSGEFEVRTAHAGTGASDIAFFVEIP
jgi:hypothetical protein